VESYLSNGFQVNCKAKEVAEVAEVARAACYKALSGGWSPSSDTILKDISDLGLKLSASLNEDAIVEEVAEVA
jgi:DNA-binding phage protein